MVAFLALVAGMVMPDDKGALTPDEKKVVVAWLEKFGREGLTCPVCRTTKWIIADHLIQPVTLGKDRSLVLGGVGYPQVQIISDPCGYTRFFNAVVIGLAPRIPDPKEGGDG